MSAGQIPIPLSPYRHLKRGTSIWSFQSILYTLFLLGRQSESVFSVSVFGSLVLLIQEVHKHIPTWCLHQLLVLDEHGGCYSICQTRDSCREQNVMNIKTLGDLVHFSISRWLRVIHKLRYQLKYSNSILLLQCGSGHCCLFVITPFLADFLSKYDPADVNW